MKSIILAFVCGTILVVTGCSQVQPRKASNFGGPEIFPYTKDNYYYGLADKSGNIIIEPQFNFYENYKPKAQIYKFNKTDGCYFASALGNVIGPFEDCRVLGDKHLIIQKNEKWALYKYREDVILGDKITDFEFDIIGEYINGLANFRKGSQKGLLDEEGKPYLITNKQINSSVSKNDNDGFSEGMISFLEDRKSTRLNSSHRL